METKQKQELGATDGRTDESPSLADQVGAAFAVRMNERIRALGITNAVVSSRCGYAESTVRKWRKGKSTPDLGAIHALAAALGVTPEWLGGGAGDVASAPEGMAGGRVKPVAARCGGAEATEGRSMDQEDVRIFFGVVRAIDHLDAQLPEGLTESVKADIALRMRYALATMARDQDLLARLNLDDLIQLASIAHKLI